MTDAINPQSEKSLYVGCGEDRREGYRHCDVREMPGIDFVCNAWEVSQHVMGLQNIYSRHMLEHLTSMEAEAALLDWHKALQIGGELYIVVPNLNFHVQQWLNAEWDETTLRDVKSDARYGFGGLFGWQRECDPRQPNYNNTYWDVHKSGYNEKRLAFLLRRAGYVDVQTQIKNDVHLVATARKSMNSGERQISPDYRNIREDHKNRYDFAANELLNYAPKRILDLACGIGYGSKMLAETTRANLTAIDIHAGAIDYGRQYYQHDNVEFIQGDAREVGYSQEFDAVVSFETIEHVEFDAELLAVFYQALKPGGIFICSTPNQDVMPFDPQLFKFHIKHYTNQEINSLIETAGFRLLKVYKQDDQKSGKVVTGDDGAFSIFVCQRPD